MYTVGSQQNILETVQVSNSKSTYNLYAFVGRFPYPDMTDAEVLQNVKTSQYLEAPDNCEDKV